jgi:hypothetical protein
MLPGIPVGPIAGPGGRVGLTYAYAYAPTEAKTLVGSTAVPVQGNSAMHLGFLPLLPRLSARGSLGTGFDGGADYSPLDVGVQLRAGALGLSQAAPWGVEGEWRTGASSLFHDQRFRARRQYRVRFEAYPRLAFVSSGLVGSKLVFGVTSLGISTGTQALSLMPNRLPPELDNGSKEWVLELPVNRNETRLEGALGLHLRGGDRAFTFALMPWIVVGSGPPDVCHNCSAPVVFVNSAWGLGFVFGSAFVFED